MPRLQAIAARPTLFGSLVFACILFALAPWPGDRVERALVAWCVFAILYVTLGALRLSGRSADLIRANAPKVDDSALVILAASLAAVVASLVAVVAELHGVKGLAPGDGAFHFALTVSTVICSWVFVQVIFAVHYAHEFYGTDRHGKERGGLNFGQDGEPDFWDFLYFAVTIGATSQTSDVAVNSRTMRRTVLAQAIFSFFFNTMVLALAINIAAGLLGV
jgi:uncharacterized membrane protein